MNRFLNSPVWIPAGALILISIRLSQSVSQWWLLLTVFVSAYLAASGITGRCPVKNFSRKQPGEAADDDADEN